MTNRFTIVENRFATLLNHLTVYGYLTFRYAAAEEDCSKSLSIDPEYVKAIARRATARTKLKKYFAAIEDQEHLLRLQPNNKQAKTDLEKLKKVRQVNFLIYKKVRQTQFSSTQFILTLFTRRQAKDNSL